MEKEMKKFIKEMKILLVELEYEDDKETKEDTIDSIYYKVKDFQNEYCD